MLSGYEKAAVFLSSMGEDAAAEVFKALDVTEVGKITMQMKRLKSVSKNSVDDVFREITEMTSKLDVRIGGEDYVKRVLLKGLGEEGAERILDMASNEGPLDSLKWVDTKTLVNFLIAEHPQTVALIICLLESTQAAEVLSALPDKLKSDVALRIATTEMISEGAVEELKEVLKGQLDVGKGKGKKVVGTKTVAEILNHCDRTTEQIVLEKIEEQDGVLADSIRQLMFVFDDLSQIDNRAMQMVLKEISTDELSVALKTASEAVKEKIFTNMSQRAVDILKEEMQVKGPVRVSDVEKAQQSIVKIARKLEAEGKIVLAGRGGEEVIQ